MNAGKELGDELRRWREKKRYSQADLVQRTKLSASVVYRAEMGESLPSRGTLLKLEEALEAPPGTLTDIADRVRAREEQLWLGLPHVVWAAPLISLLFKFSGPFQLMGCHFGHKTNDGSVEPVRQTSELVPFRQDLHRPLDGVSLMEALSSRTLDCAWMPRATFLAHQSSLNRYASLSVQAPPSEMLVVRRPGSRTLPPKTLAEFWHVGRTVCFLTGDSGEEEYVMLRPPAERRPRPLRAASYSELLDTVQDTLETEEFVLCFLNEPLTTLVKKHVRTTEAGWFPVARAPEDYAIESLLGWRGINFDFVSPVDLRLASNWIRSYLRALQIQVEFTNSRQALERTAECLDISVQTMRVALNETDVRFELSLDPRILLLFPA